jgi:hypothetical protein
VCCTLAALLYGHHGPVRRAGAGEGGGGREGRGRRPVAQPARRPLPLPFPQRQQPLPIQQQPLALPQRQQPIPLLQQVPQLALLPRDVPAFVWLLRHTAVAFHWHQGATHLHTSQSGHHAILHMVNARPTTVSGLVPGADELGGAAQQTTIGAVQVADVELCMPAEVVGPFSHRSRSRSRGRRRRSYSRSRSRDRYSRRDDRDRYGGGSRDRGGYGGGGGGYGGGGYGGGGYGGGGGACFVSHCQWA